MGAGGAKAHEASTITPAPTAAGAGSGPAGGEGSGLGGGAEAVVQQFDSDAETTALEDLAALAASTVAAADLTPGEAAAVAETLGDAITQIAVNSDPADLVAAADKAGLPIAAVLAETDLATEPAMVMALGKYLATHDVDEQLAIHAAMNALANGEQLSPEWAEAIDHLDGDRTWTGTLAEFNDAVAAYEALPHSAGSLERLEAVNRVWGYVPEPGLEGATELVGWARQKCPGPLHGIKLSETDREALPGSVADLDKKWLSDQALFQVGSMATPMAARLALKARAQAAQDTFEIVSGLSDDAWSTMPASIDDLAGWIDANATISTALENPAINGTNGASLRFAVTKATGTTDHSSTVTQSFRGWAKQQKLAELRQVAVGAGLVDASAASRAQIQNYLAAKWDPTQNTNQIQDAVTAKKTAAEFVASHAAANNSASAVDTSSASKPAGALASSHQSIPQPAKAKASTTMAASPVAKSANAFHANVVSLASKAATAASLAADIPAPTQSGSVAGHDWAGNHVGGFSKGSHESDLYTGPDGSTQWLFKPDKSNAGARAHAEAAAARIFAAAGVATVDVHVTKIGSRTGAIQPMVPGAQNLDSSPSKWSQADVDQIVANHVVSWAVGDHDGHAANMLRTPSGAVVGIDHGQAFKFCGSDQLSATWKPSSNPTPAVHTQLYSAATTGTLAAGVTLKASAAIPAIKKLQNVPDSTYASWLGPTASEGVKHSVHWVPAMRKAAQSRHGTNKVTNQQVADEFITTMVDRKNNLSNAFTGFFAKQGVADAAHITMLAPPRNTAAA